MHFMYSHKLLHSDRDAVLIALQDEDMLDKDLASELVFLFDCAKQPAPL
jgi:hypothetical protein